MAHRKQLTRLKAPYLKRILLDAVRVEDWEKYPWNLPLFRGHDFELEFTTPITIIVGENGTGKSTLLEAIGALAGYDEAGGGKGYRPSTIPAPSTRAVLRWQTRSVATGCRKSLPAGSFVPNPSTPWPDISIRRHWKTLSGPRRRTSCPGRMARALSVFSRSAAAGKASTSSTNPKAHCRRRDRSSCSRCCGAWTSRAPRK